MQKMFNEILYGGDYNPNQWPRDIWDEDMQIFDKADINSVTINVFSWAKIQPAEGIYDFSELDEIVIRLREKNYQIVMGTSTAALPAWMVKRYPETARTDYEGKHHKFGQRHNACPNSLVYQKYAAALVKQLVKRYGKNNQVVCWHVNNEYGGECFCENCEKAFRVWLRKKYKNIEALNKAWNLEFWGHTIYEWDEIVLPNALSEGIGNDKTAFAGISVDYRRFISDSMLDNYKMERDVIRQYDQKTPITTNLMGTYKGLDYFKWAKEMDIVSWDNYPSYDTPWSYTSMCHDLMRGLKNKPFMLMEQTPSQQNWQPYNSLKKPGQMRAQSYQTLAHGADTIQFFQLRRSVGGCEKFHGAVIEHSGTENTRVFREVSQLGKELKELSNILPGSVNCSKVGIIFDWDNYWALEYTSGPNKDLNYVDQIHQFYQYFYDRNIPVDMIPIDADFDKYELVVAPVLYMVKDGVAEALEAYVENGGAFITGVMSGIVDQSDNVHLGGYPGKLRKVTGVWVEEVDALAPEQTNHISFLDGFTGTCNLLCDIIHLENAECLAEYTSNFYSGTPVITENTYGKGRAYYIGTSLDLASQKKVLDIITEKVQIKPLLDEYTKAEVICRETEEETFYFLINFAEDSQIMPQFFLGKTDLLSGTVLTEEKLIQKYEVLLVSEPK